MKVLVVGEGGREHAIAWKLKQELYGKDELFVAPGNAGTAQIAHNVNIQPRDIHELTSFAKENSIDITFVGPDEPVALGLVDSLEREGLHTVGPSRAAAELEWSKIFSDDFMKKYNIPHPESLVADTTVQAIDIGNYLLKTDGAGVIKADGLAAGKGVAIYRSKTELKDAINQLVAKKGGKALMQRFLRGQEASFIVFTDGEYIIPLPHTQDHKQVFDNDQGPNTGGMGTCARTPVITTEMEQTVIRNIVTPTLSGMAQEGRLYKGILYVGLMIVDGKPYVLEYNCRGGDPETQTQMVLMRSSLLDVGYGIVEKRLNNIKPKWLPESAVTVVLATKGYPSDEYKNYLNKEILGLDRSDVIVHHAGTMHLSDGRIVNTRGRVLNITAKADNIRDARSIVYTSIGKENDGIYFEDMIYRTDIGAKALL
ncbi:MAG: phosphoribosylamine--glycine ligase [Candidatus Aenigmatarchaeota archaeon]